MRSIRRSMTIYLSALLVITLIVVGVAMDRVTAEALSARERDGVKLFQTQYEQRCAEEIKHVDEALLNQAKRLYGLIIEHNRIRWFKLTDQAFTTLRKMIPESVLIKLEVLKDKERSREDLLKEIERILSDEERKQFQESILSQAGIRRREEIWKYQALNDLSPLMFMNNPLAEAAWTATGNEPNVTLQYELSPVMFLSNPFVQVSWSAQLHVPSPTFDLLSRLYFANLLPEEYMQRISEPSTGTLYQQINAVAGANRGGASREWPSKSLGHRSLPFDHKEIDAKLPDHAKPDGTAVWTYDESATSPDGEVVYRIIYRGTRQVLTQPVRQGPAPGGPPPGTNLGSGAAGSPQRPNVAPPNRPPQQTLESYLYIQCARPKSEIEARLASFATERDEARDNLTADIRAARKNMIIQTVAVGSIAILALVIGGPAIVGIGLRPVGKLSEAVSQVSERDFKLPHDGLNLVQELVPIHSRLTQTLDLLQRAFSREKQAVADISHELRTPIAALMATIDVALRKPRTPEQYRTALEECRLISKQLGQLVERIMTLATLDAGNDRTALSRTDALELAVGCSALIRPLAAANGIALNLHPPEESIELDTDSGKVREVLMNLLHNAVEYNRPNGTIDLSFHRENDRIVFEVRDSGIGMTEEVKEKIFERFFRADPSRHATGVHAGLGLAIVKEYVARLNGTIEVESEPGVGSKFRIVLPALPAEPEFEPHHVGIEESLGTFKLTDQALSSLLNARVPEPVVQKLHPLRNKDFSRNALVGEIHKVLDIDEMKQFSTVILTHAQTGLGT